MAKRKKVKRPVVPFAMAAMVGATLTGACNPAPGVQGEVRHPRKPNARKVAGVFTVHRVNVPMPASGKGASYRFAVGATKADGKRWNPLARQSSADAFVVTKAGKVVRHAAAAPGSLSEGEITARGKVAAAYGAPRAEMRCRAGDEISSRRWRMAG